MQQQVQQPHWPAAAAITCYQPSDVRRWPLLTFLLLVRIEVISQVSPIDDERQALTGVKVRYTRLIHGYLQNGRLPGRGLRKARV